MKLCHQEWELRVQVLGVRVCLGVASYEVIALVLQVMAYMGASVVQFLVARVDIGVVINKAMTPQCGRSLVQVLVLRVDIRVVIYEAITPL